MSTPAASRECAGACDGQWLCFRGKSEDQTTRKKKTNEQANFRDDEEIIFRLDDPRFVAQVTDESASRK